MNNIRFAGILILLTLSPYLKANNDTDYITIINDSSAESCMAYNSEYVMEPNDEINIEADSLSKITLFRRSKRQPRARDN